MTALENINFSFSANPLIIIIGILLALSAAYYFYRITVPPISRVLKYFLFSVRAIILSLIIFLIFEPILTLEYLDTEQSKTLVFIDNSKSIAAEDSAARINNLNNTLTQIEKTSGSSVQFFTFGSEVKNISADSIFNITHSELNSNFSLIFDEINSFGNLADAALIISDGIITEGENPVYKAEKLGIPIFTLGIGDSSIKMDAGVNNILTNEYIYADKETVVLAEILHSGFSGDPAVAVLKEDGINIAKKNIVLSSLGITRVEFYYTPKSEGEIIITVELSKLSGEVNTNNNFKNKYINVLDKKVNVLLVSGSPSPDLSIVKNTLLQDENYIVENIVQTTSTKYLDGKLNLAKIDSADVLVLIGFPSKNTSAELNNKIRNSITDQKPFLMILSSGTDLQKINTFSDELPISIRNISSNYIPVQPSIFDINSSLLKTNSSEYINQWNNLPPVNQPRFTAELKAGSSVIAKSNFKGAITASPLVVSRAIGKSRSILVTANNIWKWKLNASSTDNNIFTDFIHNCIEWLNVNTENPQLIVNTTKREYSYGEEVEFNAQVYNENFNPVNTADLKITASNNGKDYSINLTSIGNGIYEGSLDAADTGIYNFKAAAKVEDKILGEVEGKFNISTAEIEKLNLVMNTGMLKLLANSTNGKYFDINNVNTLAEELKNYSGRNVIENSFFKELNLWSDIRLLIFIILLFGIEWFLRKKSGML